MKRRHFLSLSTIGALVTQHASASPSSFTQWEGFYKTSHGRLKIKAHQLPACVDRLSKLTKAPIRANGNKLSFEQSGHTHTLEIELT